MGLGAEIITGRVTNPGAVFTAVTPATGDNFTVRNYQFQAAAYVETLWGLEGTAGTVRVRSPRMHDNVQGLRANVTAGTPQPLLPYEVEQPLYPQDTLIVEMTGGAAETDVVSLLNWYADVPGVDARLHTWDEIKPRIKNILTIETAHNTGATLGDYGGGVAINSSFDLLKANTDYAILGYLTSVSVCSVGYRGPDTGNLRIGGPGSNQRIESRDWFVELSRSSGRPFIPVINSANKAGTTIDLVHNAGAVAVTVDSIVAELG